MYTLIAKLKKPLVILSLILMAWIIYLLLHMLFVLDLSQQKPYRVPETYKNQRLYLISYADGGDVYLQNRNILAASAVNRGFDFIFNYRREHIDPEFIQQNPIMNEKDGAGYWLWKPYLILKTLEQVPEGSIVMYLDSGGMIRQPLRQYLMDGFASEKKDILLFAYNPKVYGYTKRVASGDTFIALNCTEEHCYNSNHVWAGVVVVRNTAKSRAFIAEWLKHCQDTQMLKGKTFRNPNHPTFIYQQHDEGILSVLAARERKLVSYVAMDANFFEHIAMHRRKAFESDRSLMGYFSTMFVYSREFRILNWGWVVKLREMARQRGILDFPA